MLLHWWRLLVEHRSSVLSVVVTLSINPILGFCPKVRRDSGAGNGDTGTTRESRSVLVGESETGKELPCDET